MHGDLGDVDLDFLFARLHVDIMDLYKLFRNNFWGPPGD